MNGVSYITNEKGKKTAVVIDLKKHGELWEDFYDKILIEERKDEEKISFEEVKNTLKKQGKL